MKTCLVSLAFFVISLSASAQLYYSDIISTRQTNQQYKQLRGAQVKKIKAVSYEGSEPAKDFFLEQSISDDGSKIITHSASVGNTESFFIGYYKANRINKTVDSSGNAINTVTYDYDNSGKLSVVNSVSKDFDGTFTTTEVHAWSYNASGLPDTMYKVKNLVDSTLVTFRYDDLGNVAEERLTRNGRPLETYYYYYNAKKQLTDVVRFNLKAKAMIPDYTFDYDNAGHLTQMTQTQAGKANYLIFKYLYNENGLKQKEAIFNKQKELLGRIDYRYE